MADYQDSSQLNLWLFQSPEQLEHVRVVANNKARKFLTENHDKDDSVKPLVEQFACGYHQRQSQGNPSPDDDCSDSIPSESPNGNAYLTAAEEETLVSFYIQKLPVLIGPAAHVHRLRRESKVTATAALLTRRFFLSNSVMLHDPKCIMVAAAFLACKVEDAMADIRYLEQGTQALQAPVAAHDIISAELYLLEGCHFDLFCFHPYKPVLALTEDLRTYLKSDKGKNLVHVAGDVSSDHPSRLLSGNDLRPIYDTARTLLEKVIVSDIPLLFSPARVALAALMVAQETVLLTQPDAPRIDFLGYLTQRFEDEVHHEKDETVASMTETLDKICGMIRGIRDAPEPDMGVLKSIHKKLKKVRWWNKETKKNRKKDGETEGERKAKKQKTTDQ